MIFGCAATMLLAAALAWRTLPRDSCTVDEFGNLPLTVAYWSGEALHIDRGNPPLTRWVQGLAFLGQAPDLGATRADLAAIETSWDLGYRFERAHPSDYHALLVRARLGSLLLLMATVAGVFFWARAIAGMAPALVSASLAATCPNLLAHGRLVTPDAGVAAAVIWAGWAAHRMFVAPSLPRAVVAGLLASAAVLAKFSALAVVPVFAAAVALAAGSARVRAARLGAFILALLVPLFAAYGTLAPGVLGGVPLPFPAPFVDGLAAQLKEPPYPAYLLGAVREGGWATYYLVAFVVKTPLPVIALAALAVAFLARRRLPGGALPLALAAALFVALGFATKKNVGIRYILPIFPLLHVAFAPLFAGPRGVPESRGGVSPPTVRRAALVLAGVAVLLGVVASEAPLSAFNGVERLLGGKRAVLVDSNLDWGQGLPELREWMEREGIPVVQLAYFGRVDPSIYGITWRTLQTEEAPPGGSAAAISATLAVGRPYVVRWKHRPFVEAVLGWSDPLSWAWTRDLEPDAELAGGSILVWKDVGAAASDTTSASGP